jgi:lysophospholipase L1-like esterase
MAGIKIIVVRLAIIIFGIIVGLLIIEIGLRFIPETRWKALIGKSPTRYLLYKTDDDIGWVHLPNAHINFRGNGEYDVDVRINSLGLRDREHTYEKPPDTFRILVLGDSFAEAIQVPVERAFPAQLERCLTERVNQEFEVINTGTSSYGPGDELLFFTHEGVKYDPDLVLVAVFVGNDVKNMGRAVDDSMIQSFGGYEFYLNEGRLQKRWIEWAEPNYEISPLEHFLRRYSTLYYVFRAPDSRVCREVDKVIERWWPQTSSSSEPVEEKSSDFPDYAYDRYLIIFASNFPDNPIVPPRIKELWTLFKAAFLELQTQVEAQNATLTVVIIPQAAQIHNAYYQRFVAEFLNKYDSLHDSDWDNWDLKTPNQAVVDFLIEQNIPVLDLMPGFQAYDATHNDLLYYQEDIHFNEKGHQLAADLMCDWLIEKALVPSE